MDMHDILMHFPAILYYAEGSCPISRVSHAPSPIFFSMCLKANIPGESDL